MGPTIQLGHMGHLRALSDWSGCAMSYSLSSRAHCTLFGHRGGQYINHSVNHQDNIKVPVQLTPTKIIQSL